MRIDKEQWKWTRGPKVFSISDDMIEIIPTKRYLNARIPIIEIQINSGHVPDNA